jgi:hypothetical protein
LHISDSRKELILIEEEIQEGLKEKSNAMKKGRAYKNIHAILNKYPRKRMGYPQTTVKVS